MLLALPSVAGAVAADPSQSGGLPALAAQVAALEEETAEQAARIAELEAEVADQDARIVLLEADSAELQSVLAVDSDGDLVITGANLRVQGGAGSIGAAPNGGGT